MWRLREFFMRLFNVVHPARAERELDRELAAHRALAAEDLVKRGTSPDEAQRMAHRHVGAVDLVKEQHREARSFRFVDDLVRDLRYAGRMIRRAPGVSAIAVTSLALGIGANTAAFSLVDSLIAHTLPVPRPDELVNLREVWPDSRPRAEAPTWEFTGLRDGAVNSVTIAAVSLVDRSNITLSTPAGAHIDGGRARAAMVSGNYFPMTQVPAAIGRALGPDDDRTPGGHPVVVLSDAYWARSLQRSPDVLKDTFTINGMPFAIIGVMPRGFDGEWIGRPVDFWATTMMQRAITPEADSLTKHNDYWLRLVGRLAPAVTRAQAEAALQPVYQQVMRDEEGPTASAQDLAELARRRLELVPGAHGYSPEVEARRPLISILSIVSALVLLVVCANVAGLLLARAGARRREFAVRLAIGANATRLARQLLSEGLLLALIGGAGGLALGLWGTRILAGLLESGPVKVFWAQSSWFTFDVTPSWRGLLFTAAVSLAAGCLFTLAPVLQARAISLAPALSGRTTSDRARSRISHGLVVLQVALALVVFVAAVLLTRTLVGLQSKDLGFDQRNLLLVWAQPTSTGRQGQDLVALWRDTQAQLLAVPGIIAASASNTPVLGGGNVPTAGPPQQLMQVAGQPARTTTAPGWRTFIQPGYFKTMGVRLLRGREFTERDNNLAPPVAIINETFARFYFGDEDPIGQHVRLAALPRAVEIVGVVRDMPTNGSPRIGEVKPMMSYMPYTYNEAVRNLVVMCVAVRSVSEPHAFVAAIREALRRVDPSLAVVKIDTVGEQLDDVLVPERLLARLTGFFGGVAGLLACLGLYGLVAHMTARRTAEIGVRMALGATRGRVLATTLAEGARLVAAGIVLGVPAALVASRALRSQLFGVGPYDPGTIVLSVTLMIGIAFAATWLPARRAACIDPMTALREE